LRPKLGSYQYSLARQQVKQEIKRNALHLACSIA